MTAVVAVTRCPDCQTRTWLTIEAGGRTVVSWTSGPWWWCECSPRTVLLRPLPGHCCEHLLAVGKLPAAEANR